MGLFDLIRLRTRRSPTAEADPDTDPEQSPEAGGAGTEPPGGSTMDAAQDPHLSLPGRQTERAMRMLLTIGLVSLAAISVSGWVDGGGVRFVIWAVIAALAAATVGGALGLLFGLPTAQAGAPVIVVERAAQATSSPTSGVATTPTTTPGQATPAAGSPNAAASAEMTSSTSQEQRELDIGYRDSTSLEQVADWLTKIIVGLTLTQFASWEIRFQALARDLTEAMIGPLGRSTECLDTIRPLAGTERASVLASALCQVPPASAVPGGVLIALGATIGFLVSYLWMRRYFILELVVAKKIARDFLNVREAQAKSVVAAQEKAQKEQQLAAAKAVEEKLQADLEKARTEVSLQKAELERVQTAAALQQTEEARQRAELEEALRAAGRRGRAQKAPGELIETTDSDAVSILRKGKGHLPGESKGIEALAAIEQAILEKPTDPQDPWRGKFGEQSTARGLTLEPTVDPTSDPNTFRVALVVHTVEMPPPEAMVGMKVVYYLHPTFGQAPRVSTIGADGRAPLELYAYGAFTVGVVIENGTTLELNLATLPNVPDTFRSR